MASRFAFDRLSSLVAALWKMSTFNLKLAPASIAIKDILKRYPDGQIFKVSVSGTGTGLLATWLLAS